MIFSAFNNRASGENWNAHPSGSLSGKVMFGQNITVSNATGFPFLAGRHGTGRYRIGGWVVWNRGTPPMSTPEPGSLMLLSTGLLGIAGTMRRKLLRS
jgi:PEP-CTERM motif